MTYPIIRTPGVVGGRWRIAGTRIPINAIKSLATHSDVDRIETLYPGIAREHIEAAIAFEPPPEERRLSPERVREIHAEPDNADDDEVRWLAHELLAYLEVPG